MTKNKPSRSLVAWSVLNKVCLCIAFSPFPTLSYFFVFHSHLPLVLYFCLPVYHTSCLKINGIGVKISFNSEE